MTRAVPPGIPHPYAQHRVGYDPEDRRTSLGGGSKPFSFPRCPFGFDLDHSFQTCRVVTEAAPFPIFWTRDESALDRISVNVAQFLNVLLSGPQVEVVIARLPKMVGSCWRTQLSSNRLLEHLERNG
jgi:hypothetical protein